MKLTFRQLEVFRAVNKNRNYTQAARQLFLSQPAVSIQIKQLEQQIGMTLFENIGKKLRLTQAGKLLLHSATEINQNLQQLEQNIQDLQGLKLGNLELAVVSTANAFSTRLLAKFLELYPKVTFSLNVGNRNHIVDLINKGELELAIMGLPPENLKVRAEVIMANPLVIVAKANHPLAAQTTINIKQLANEMFVVREFGSGTRYVLADIFTQQGLDFIPKLEFSSAEAIKEAVLAGLGLALVSKISISSELDTGSLVILPVKNTPINKHWHLVSTRKLSPIAARFHDFILAEAKNLVY